MQRSCHDLDRVAGRTVWAVRGRGGRGWRGTTLDGATLFRVKGCAGCHDGPDSTALIDGPPNLSDAESWAADRTELPASDYLAESIRSPGAFISPEYRPDGGPLEGMPTLAVSEEEIDALVAYLLDG